MSFPISFSNTVKNELARMVGGKSCCLVAELASLMRMGGNMVIGGNQTLGINFTTENAAVARKFLVLVKQRFQLKTQVVVSKGRRLKKNNSYLIKIMPTPEVMELLAQLGLMREGGIYSGQDKAFFRKACCRKGYLRGAFLGGGSVNRPEGDYHLELVTSSEEYAKTLVGLMKYFQFPARMTDRKADFIVYLKDGDAVEAFLRLIGASEAVKTFKKVRKVKDMRNQVNRLVNCETANLQKTVDAAFRQVEFIKQIEAYQGLGSLPANLREAAEVRLNFPEATLQELVDHLGGTVGKSGMNHRLRKLAEIAKNLPERGPL
ncbi:MAG: DNA-binding protein WhiA [Sporomusaceae bacterium]|nr:DNA-binding protein WhiA [Sporomusaceae bacterium]